MTEEETTEEWLARMRKEIDELKEKIAENQRAWDEFMAGPHQEYLKSKKEFEEYFRHFDTTARDESD